jgi:predicted transcriptional regulator
MKDILTVRLDSETKEKLEKIAKATARTKSYIASEAIREYINLNEWQIQAIKRGIDQAKKGKVIAHEKIKAKWEKKLANSLD